MGQKTKTMLQILGFVLFIVAAVFSYKALSGKTNIDNDISDISKNSVSQSEDGEKDQDMKAPDFTVYDINDKAVKLSDMLGKPVVLNFWASWCPPCKGEMPEFDEIYKKNKDDVVFMMVDLVDGQRETKKKGADYIKSMGFSFPVYFDTKQDAAERYGIYSIPTTIFIDKDGYIVTGAQSALDGKTLQKGIDLIK